jgi:hypothetical protein
MLVTHEPVESSLIQEPNHNKSVHLALGTSPQTAGCGPPVVGQFQLNEGKYEKAERVSTLIQSARFTRRSV